MLCCQCIPPSTDVPRIKDGPNRSQNTEQTQKKPNHKVLTSIAELIFLNALGARSTRDQGLGVDMVVWRIRSTYLSGFQFSTESSTSLSVLVTKWMHFYMYCIYHLYYYSIKKVTYYSNNLPSRTLEWNVFLFCASALLGSQHELTHTFDSLCLCIQVKPIFRHQLYMGVPP